MITKARVRCGGFVNAELVLPGELDRLMEQVESGDIPRPEIEIVKNDGQTICAGPLFREGGGICMGWLVGGFDEKLQIDVDYYLTPPTEELMRSEELLHFGAPQQVPQFLILERSQAADLIVDLVNGKDVPFADLGDRL